MKKLFVLTATILSLPVAANAAVVPKALEKAISQKVQSLAKETPRLSNFRDDSKQCADFSGTWVGTCQIADQTIDAKLAITQNGCNSITLDGDTMAFNQNKSETGSSMLFFTSGASSAKLSEDRQAAVLVANFMADSPLLPRAITGVVDAEIRKEGEALKLSGEVGMRMSADKNIKIEGSCSLVKSN